MKNFLLTAALLFALVSCKVSENITVDQISKTSDLAEKKTFKVIEAKDETKNTAQLNRLFEKKLMENGFTQVDENPELLIQSVIASVNFEKEVLGFVGSVGLTDSNSYSPPETEHGQYGKVIFLIQDAKTNEVLWMGTGTGVLTANEILNSKDIKSALDQLLADLR